MIVTPPRHNPKFATESAELRLHGGPDTRLSGESSDLVPCSVNRTSMTTSNSRADPSVAPERGASEGVRTQSFGLRRKWAPRRASSLYR